MKGLTQFARAMAANRIAAVNHERVAVLVDANEDAVHAFRVSLRRLEPVLELFDIEPLGFDSAEASKQLEIWLRGAGRVRDCDVVRRLIPEQLCEGLLFLRRERAAELVRLVQSGTMPISKRHRVEPSWNDPEVLHFAAITLPHLGDAYFRSGARAVAKKRSLLRLHEFRLHGKSLRYSLELFQPLYGPRLRVLQRLLKRMQQVLGEMADARAGLKLMDKLGAEEVDGAPLLDLAESKRDEFASRWLADVPDSHVAARWVDYLRRFARPAE
jgi:CHAD domain-containing protein